MRKVLLFLTLFFILTACSEEKTEPSNELTVQPLELSEKETTLVNKTGIGYIEYFTLNGTLHEQNELVFEVEVFENGKSRIGTKSFGSINKEFEDTIVSFGTTSTTGEGTMDILVGTPSGLTSQQFEPETKISGSMFQKFIHEEKDVVLNQPIYLAAFAGTNKNHMTTLGGEDYKSQRKQLKKQDLAIALRVTVVNKQEITPKSK
ncbi:hypothetical protein [Salinibacillus xinjiangensis]|uniref:Lipoprotein n=1 Tax=Salinibacillus xinjiangensis TaxID=1229268 RepID=A0A6G1X8M3_9BACI|nr:hypothetical protein [Salinibacillus xinjiangensis]MRG87292.1 hypothetical protein [Salinibacillus xinjiangensis]